MRSQLTLPNRKFLGVFSFQPSSGLHLWLKNSQYCHDGTFNIGRQECYDFLNAAVDRNEEGIILKEPTSVYKPNKREHAGWYKVKPEYMTDLSDSLDLLVVGGYFGKSLVKTATFFHPKVENKSIIWNKIEGKKNLKKFKKKKKKKNFKFFF